MSEESTDDLVTVLLTASRVLVGISAQSLAVVEHAVTPSQFRTLVLLDRHGASRLNQLARRLDVGPSTALRAVDRLVSAGLVERSENASDRRHVLIGLTAGGRTLVDRVTRARRRSIEAVVRRLPAQRRRHLVDALLAFAEAADEPLVTADAAARLGW